jgi:PAS domain S-box-containing protein
MKLATKLTILFVLLAIIPLAIVGYLAYDNGRRTIEQNTINHLVSTNILKQAEFDRWVEDNARQLRSLAGQPFFKDQFAAEIAAHDPADPEHREVHRKIREDHFLPTLKEEGGFVELFILRASDGLILVSTDEKEEGKYRESELYFVEGKNRTYIENVYYFLTLGEAAMTIATPIRDREGNLLAVLAGHLDLAEMSEIMEQRSGLSQTEDTYLVNTFNFFVTEPRFGQGYALRKAVRTEGVETCLEHNDGVGFYDDYRGMPVMGAYRWMPDRELCILTEVDQAEAFAPVVALRNIVRGIGAAVALIVALLGVLFARTITRPLRQLVKGAEEIGRGNLEYRIKVGARDEIGQLAGAFNEMAANLRQSLGETARGQRLLLALSQAAQAVQRARTPEEVYRMVGDEVGRLGYNASVFTLAEDRVHMTIAHLTLQPALQQAAEKLTGLSARDFRFPLVPGGCYQRIISTGETVFIEPFIEPVAEALPGPLRPLASRLAALLRIEQAIIAPLTVGGETVGLLTVSGSGLSEADVPAVTAFANQTAIALENARAGEALRESEQWLSATLRSIGDAVIATDAQGLVTLMNSVAKDLTGWDEAEAVGKPLEDVFNIVNEQTGERAENPVARVLREGVVVGLANHTVLIAKDGTKRPIADSGAPMKDEEGNIIGTVMVFRDITERRRAEEALQRLVNDLSALNTMAAIVNQSLDINEILNRAMDEALRQVGVEAAAMLLLDEEGGELALVAHRGLSDEFVRAASRLKVGEGLAGRVAQTGQPAILGDLAEYPGALKAYVEKERVRSAASVPLIGRTGVIGVMNLGAASLHYFDAAGLELLMALGQQIAIGVEKARLYSETSRRNRELSVLYTINRATAESLDLEKTLHNAVEATLEALGIEVGGIYLMEPDGETLTLRVYRGVSDEVAKNLQHVKMGEGMSGRAAAEKTPVVLDVQDYPSQRLAPYILREGLQTLASTPLLSAGQAVGAMNLSTRRPRAFPPEELALLTAIGQQLGSAVQNARLYEAVQQELAERKRAEEALRDAQEKLIRQEKLAVLGQLAGGVGHELRNPLGAIKNAAYFLNMVIEKPDPEVKETLDILEKEVATSERIISSLLDFARPKPPIRREVDVNHVVQETLSRTSVPDNVEVVSQLGEALPTILADPDQLTQVFGNIILNAVQAMPEGGQLTVKTWQVSEKPARSGQVAVSITDTGVGISEENLNKLFEPLFTTKAKGIGLGLALTRTLVEGHGGTIEVESEVGKGSTFTVKLPVAG